MWEEGKGVMTVKMYEDKEKDEKSMRRKIRRGQVELGRGEKKQYLVHDR